MPIDFICSECQDLLRTPDDSAGKKAKCPRCGAVQDVPQRGSKPEGVAAASDAPESAAPDDNPFRELDSPPASSEAAFSSSSLTSGDNPYSSPAAAGAVKTHYEDSSPREGLPWESQGYSIRTFLETVKLVLGSSTPAFYMMHRKGGLAAPIFFLMLGGTAGYLVAAVFASVLQVGVLGLAAGAGGEIGGADFVAAAVIQVVVQFMAALMYGTIGAAIFWLISGSLAHLMLMLLGESHCHYETTLRVGGYALGAAGLLNAIPGCGGLVSLVMAVVVYILGLSAAHGISQGKSAAAVLTPFAVCCVGTIGVGGAAAYFIAQAASNGGF